jgi:hypothetical protein
VSPAVEGWYVDPSTGTNLRFWSGSTWTDEVAPFPAEEPLARRVELFDVSRKHPLVEAEADHPPLDTDLEHTQLTRRELRARRGTDPDLNDAPRHLPPVPAIPLVEEQPAEGELETPLVVNVEPAPPEPATEQAKNPRQRRSRIIRLSVLLGVLAVVSSVGVLTAGTL